MFAWRHLFPPARRLLTLLIFKLSTLKSESCSRHVHQPIKTSTEQDGKKRKHLSLYWDLNYSGSRFKLFLLAVLKEFRQSFLSFINLTTLSELLSRLELYSTCQNNYETAYSFKGNSKSFLICLNSSNRSS
jgi:hypothetical protein